MFADKKPYQEFASGRWLRIATLLFLAYAAWVRLHIYHWNRNLFIDEANVARNIWERGLPGLTKPLSYEQYAPPLFLWMLKISATLFGYSEQALRLFPMLSGIAVLVLAFLILRKTVSDWTAWYPLGFLSVSYIMLQYSSQLKQYMPDAMIALALVYLALCIPLQRKRFFWIWLLAGTLAIWASMPSVFILAGVGSYYLMQCLEEKKHDRIKLIVAAAVCWGIQFGLYYWFILKPQAETDYLQNFHREFFLFGRPHNQAEWDHNAEVVRNVFCEVSGYDSWSYLANRILLVLGLVVLAFRNRKYGLLLAVPLGLVLLAAALNRYSLIPRVAIFMMPLFLLLIASGADFIMRRAWVPLRLVLLYFGIAQISKHNLMGAPREHWEDQEVTRGYAALKERGIAGNQFYLFNSSVPAYIYYTEIHPNKDQWRSLQNAHRLTWDADYARVSAEMPARAAFMITGSGGDELNSIRQKLTTHTQLTDSVSLTHGWIWFLGSSKQ